MFYLQYFLLVCFYLIHTSVSLSFNYISLFCTFSILGKCILHSYFFVCASYYLSSLSTCFHKSPPLTQRRDFLVSIATPRTRGAASSSQDIGSKGRRDVETQTHRHACWDCTQVTKGRRFDFSATPRHVEFKGHWLSGWTENATHWHT